MRGWLAGDTNWVRMTSPGVVFLLASPALSPSKGRQGFCASVATLVFDYVACAAVRGNNERLPQLGRTHHALAPRLAAQLAEALQVGGGEVKAAVVEGA